MAHPEDNGGILSSLEEIRDYEFTRGQASRNEEVAAVEAEITRLRKEYDDHMATHEEVPTPGPLDQRFLGMSTEADKWSLRASEVGRPVNVRRRFKSGWTPSGMVAMAEECHAVGCLPFISSKMGSNGTADWSMVANGGRDEDAEWLGVELAALGYPIRVTFHHEPRPASVSDLVVWGRALTRLFTRMRAGAGNKVHNLILGPVDNGFPWSPKWTGGVTKADLDRIYTAEFMAACDVLGADFYNGATNTNEGEAAWYKMRGFAQYFDARGFTSSEHVPWKYDVGEWNFVKAEECDQTWDFLNGDEGKDFNCVSLFNSAENNRTDLPTSLGGSWVLRPGTERMAAFQRMLDSADLEPVPA